MYLYCLTQENYPGLSKKTKDKLPLAKSKTARSTARPPLLGWRCALVRILVFSFHLLSSSRRWLRWIDSGFLSEGFSVQARSVADPLLQCSFFSFSSEDSFHRVAEGEFKAGPPPLEAILVIFGRRALIFFCLKALEKKWKMTPLLCACAVVITLET